MVKNLLKIDFEGTMGEMRETAKRSLEIKQHDDGKIYCVYTHLNYELNKTHDKKYLNINIIKAFMETLSNITLPAFPEHLMGCDGGFTEITIGGYSGQSHYRWWSCPPIGWETLDKVTNEIMEYCLNEFDDE